MPLFPAALLFAAGSFVRLSEFDLARGSICTRGSAKRNFFRNGLLYDAAGRVSGEERGSAAGAGEGPRGAEAAELDEATAVSPFVSVGTSNSTCAAGFCTTAGR